MASPVRSLARVSLPARRALHSTVARSYLIGPSDPVSNIRHVIYDTQPGESSGATKDHHPYSLREFSDDPHSAASDTDHGRYQWKMHSQQLDALNHRVWAEVRSSAAYLTRSSRRTETLMLQTNTRFEAAKAEVLGSLPANASPEDAEVVLTHFYRHWSVQEADRQAKYSAEWRKRNWENIVLAAKVQYRTLGSRLGLL
jgi:apoptogenic protein 1